MGQEDRYGLTLSTNSAEAAADYREGVDLLLSAWTGAAEAFDRAIAADPDFALAHIARGRYGEARNPDRPRWRDPASPPHRSSRQA